MTFPALKSRVRGSTFLSWLLLLLPLSGSFPPPLQAAQQPTETEGTEAGLPPPAKRKVDFVHDIKPILSTRCYVCHSEGIESGGFRLDAREAALQGGASGPAILPGRSAESRLIRFVSGIPPKMRMPQAGERLSDEKIGLLRAWIDQGAEWPDDFDAAQHARSRDHWAYQPLLRPEVPKVPDESWPRTPIDHFILARLEEEGFKPSEAADRRTLLRRVTLDLTGLQPTPEEYRSFQEDRSPDAFPRVVDRLLGSLRYGERWARHWMDVVHYADSQGHDQDRPRENSWPYRDYLIRSFNQDKPYARFVEEQIAGDVLFPDDPRATVATGFIATGPFDESSMIFIVDDTEDKKQAQNLDRDDMLMTTMSTFISTTVHCARCHDHKFDPITQAEYYNLQSVFAGVDRADRPFDSDPETHILRQQLLSKRLSLEVRQMDLNDRIDAMTSPGIRHLEERIESLEEERDAPSKPTERAASTTLGYQSEISLTETKKKWVQVDLKESAPIHQIYLVPVDLPDQPGFGFPARFRVDLSNDPLFVNFQTVADHTEADFPNPGPDPYGIQTQGQRARYIRVTALSPGKGYWLFALSELVAFSGHENVAFQGTVTALDSTEFQPFNPRGEAKWSRDNLVDGYTSLVNLDSVGSYGSLQGTEDLVGALKSARRRGEIEVEIEKLGEQRVAMARSQLDPGLQSELAEVERKLKQVNRQLSAMPPAQMVYSGTADFAAFNKFQPSKGIPRSISVLRRGEITQPLEPASPGTLSLIQDLDPHFELEEPHQEGKRRAELAKWITDPKNVLTWRSVVNRIWHYHFGRGLVDTPSDFGYMGGRPSHAQLLDWLALWFLDNGGSIKKLHKLILTSSVYQQSSQDNSEYSKTDAENRNLWRMNRRPLDAESIRDSVLQASGKLDLTMGGPPAKQFDYQDPNPNVTPLISYETFDADHPANYRRSVYRWIFRTRPDPFMEVLDSPDSSQLAPTRNASTTSLQALTMWNNPFILSQSRHLAARVAREVGDDLRAQLEAAYQQVLGRLPTDKESQELTAYAAKHGMTNVCRLIFNTNEFMFVN